MIAVSESNVPQRGVSGLGEQESGYSLTGSVTGDDSDGGNSGSTDSGMLHQSVTVVFFPSSLRPDFRKAESRRSCSGILMGRSIHEQHATSGPDVPASVRPHHPPRAAASQSSEGDESSMFNILHKLSADTAAGEDERS